MTDTADALAALAHELKTPLAAIIGYADAMRARAFGPLGETYARSAETIHAAALDLQALVDDLAGGRMRPVERFDARGPLAEALRLFALRAAAAGVELASDLGEGPLMVEADPLALKQIAINLLANALAATPRGGKVSVTLGPDGGGLGLAVEDTGPGVTAGEGLGLAIVRRLVAALSGEFVLETLANSGARASVRLPAA